MPRVKPRCLVKIPWRVGHESDRFSYVLSLSFFYQEHLTNATEGTTTAEPTPQILQMISMMGSDRRKVHDSIQQFWQGFTGRLVCANTIRIQTPVPLIVLDGLGLLRSDQLLHLLHLPERLSRAFRET